MKNIVLITKGTSGDVLPSLGLACALKHHGYQVLFLTHCAYADLVSSVGLDFVPLDTPAEFEKFVEDGALLNDPRGVVTFFQRHIIRNAFHEYELIKAYCTKPQTIIIMHHLSGLVPLLIAEQQRLPLVRLFATPSQVKGILLLEKLCESILSHEINQLREQIHLTPIYSHWSTWLGYPQLNLGLWPEWFAPIDPQSHYSVVPIGFMTYDKAEQGELPADVLALLHTNSPPVLITGGTGVSLGSEFYTVSAQACHLAARQAILVTRHEKLLPMPLPAEIAWFKYLPFANLMPHISAVVHHGGIGISARAMKAGIPQLVLAHGADRPDNARRLQSLGIATYLPQSQWQPYTIMDALYQLINNPNVQQRCQEVRQQMNTADSTKIMHELIANVFTLSTF